MNKIVLGVLKNSCFHRKQRLVECSSKSNGIAVALHVSRTHLSVIEIYISNCRHRWPSWKRLILSRQPCGLATVWADSSTECKRTSKHALSHCYILLHLLAAHFSLLHRGARGKNEQRCSFFVCFRVYLILNEMHLRTVQHLAATSYSWLVFRACVFYPKHAMKLLLVHYMFVCCENGGKTSALHESPTKSTSSVCICIASVILCFCSVLANRNR